VVLELLRASKGVEPLNDYQRDSGWPHRPSFVPPAPVAPAITPAVADPMYLCHGVAADMRSRRPELKVGAIRLLPRPHDEVPDSGIKAIISLAGSDEPLGLLVVSSAVDPLATDRAVTLTQGARTRLGPDLGSVVLEPLVTGRVGERAYVMWPFHRVLHPSRIANLARRVGLYPRVLRWLIDVTRQTLQPVPESARAPLYGATLLTIAQENHFPRDMRDASSHALERLTSQAWQPWYALEHNDLWIGNLLVPRGNEAARKHVRGFIVIDWEGARFEGYPVLDLVRFALSSRLPQSWLRNEVTRLRDVLQCDPSDMRGYTLAALGAMGQNLGYFPLDRFRQLAHEAFEAIVRVT
jgi:hypothetical protein